MASEVMLVMKGMMVPPATTKKERAQKSTGLDLISSSSNTVPRESSQGSCKLWFVARGHVFQ